MNPEVNPRAQKLNANPDHPITRINRVAKPAIQSVIAKGSKALRGARRLRYYLVPEIKNRATNEVFAARSSTENEIYSPKATTPAPSLSRKDLARFQRDGWIGPFPLLQPKGVKTVCHIHEKLVQNFKDPKSGGTFLPGAFQKKPWSKSMHAFIPEFYDIARHPAIVNRVGSILGKDIIAWGFSVNLYRPGMSHRWRVDVEHRRWRGVSVFLGLKNITLASTLKVISCSHRIRKSPQDMDIKDDSSALDACRQYEKRAKLVPVPLAEGEFFIFDGPLWHGSKNGSYRPRTAAIIQYSPADQRIEIPLNWNEPVQWHPAPPPCVLVRGKNRRSINPLVGRPNGSNRF